MTQMTRILIADHHGIFVQEMAEVLEMTASFTVADRAADGDEVLLKIRDNDYDLLLLDISLPGRNALGVLAEIKAVKPQLPVLILSLFPEEQYTLHALKSGASGCLTKGCSTHELLEALETIAAGKVYVSAALRQLKAAHADFEIRDARYGTLSDREYQVMLLLADGKSTREIAEELLLGVKTIDTYCAQMQQKLQLKSIDELVRYFLLHRVN
jgi:two-component system, NarL family, invasion response regulator UvrY